MMIINVNAVGMYEQHYVQRFVVASCGAGLNAQRAQQFAVEEQCRLQHREVGQLRLVALGHTLAKRVAEHL